MGYIITQYPVTRRQLERLSKVIGASLEMIVMSTIKARNNFDILTHFSRLKTDAVYLFVSDPAGWPSMPLLQFVSIFIRSKRYFVIDPDFQVKPFGVLDSLKGLASVVFYSFLGFVSLFSEWRRLFFLKKASRLKISGSWQQRITYLKTTFWLGLQAGGSVAHTSGVVKGLIEKGYDVDFVSIETPVGIPDVDAFNFHFVKPRKTYVLPREINYYRHNQVFIDQASPIFRKSAGIIYQRLSLGNCAGVVLSRRHKVPLIIEYNGSETWLARNWGTPLFFPGLSTMAENVCLRHAHVVVTVSTQLGNELIQRGVDPARIVVSPNGADATAFDPGNFTKEDRRALRRQYGIPEDAVVVTFVGTFGPWHGAEVFAKSIAALEKSNLYFMFIGDGVRRSTVEKIISDSGMSEHVSLMGLVDQEEIPLYLAASDILISPHVPNPDGSPFFGSPTKLFEYLASGRPVIGSDVGQIIEVLDGCPHARDLASVGKVPPKGSVGILVASEDVSQLAGAIQFLAENPDWRKVAGKNARNRVIERYTWEHHVTAILDGLREAQVLDAAPAPRRTCILFNGLHSKSGGGLTYLKNMLPLFAADQEIDVHLCVHINQRKDLPSDIGNITVHYLDFAPGFWRLQLREQIEIPKLVRRIGADVTFSPANYGPLMVPNSVILLRNALSVAFVERRPMKLTYWALVYLGTLLSVIRAKHVVAVSNYARRTASAGLIGLFSDRLTVIPHGVSRKFSPPDTAIERERFLLAVSDLYVQKNLDTLVRAVDRLSTDHPEIRLKIAGHPIDADYFAYLRRIVSESDLNERVEFLGSLPETELLELYRKCAVFVFPSIVETFGNPLVEAMACGAPIACSALAAMPEVVDDAAVFFDPLDVEDMVSAIDGLLKDAERRRGLSARARERAKAFSWEKTAEKTLAVLKAAAISRPGESP